MTGQPYTVLSLDPPKRKRTLTSFLMYCLKSPKQKCALLFSLPLQRLLFLAHQNQIPSLPPVGAVMSESRGLVYKNGKKESERESKRAQATHHPPTGTRSTHSYKEMLESKMSDLCAVQQKRSGQSRSAFGKASMFHEGSHSDRWYETAFSATTT